MTSQGTKSKVRKAVWHNSTVHTFCDICIQAIDKMFMPNTHFNKQGWSFIIEEFHKETGLNYGHKQLKNKWDALKKNYRLWKDLMRNETGLVWDEHKNTIGADDAWWEEKLKVNRNYEMFRLGGIEPQLEEKLELMFSSSLATKECAISPECNAVVTPQEEQADVEGRGDSIEGVPFEDNLDEKFEGGNTQAGLTSNKKRNVEVGGDKSSVPFKKGKRQSEGSPMLARHLDTFVGAVACRSSTMTSKVTESDVPSLRAIVSDLKNIPGIDIYGDIFMFATEFLEDKVKREVYIELDSPAHKLKWLTYHFIHKGPNKNMLHVVD